MSGDNRGSKAAAIHDDIGGGGSNAAAAAASSVTPRDDDYVKVKGLKPDQFLRMWRNKTGIQHLTLEQVWDHLHRISACSMALFSGHTISTDQYKESIAEARTLSYEILCKGGTSENWPYPIHHKKKKKKNKITH